MVEPVVEIKRRKLNKQQLAVLNWLLKFRFSTSKQIATHLGKTDHKAIQSKLQILEAQDLIAKRYDKSYKLAGRPAEYFLTPKGSRALVTSQPDTTIPDNVMKALYKNKTVSDAFLKHCTGIVDVVLKLQELHGIKLRIYGASDLRAYDYFPDWTPDLFLSYKASKGVIYRAFLDIWDDSKPFFVGVRKTRNYITYAEEGDWPEDVEFPALLAICATKHDQKKLNRQMKKALSDSSDADDTPCGTTTLDQLNQATKPTAKVWTSVSWADEPQSATLLGIIRKS
ncbi:MAG TPA: replication-relaxation family protein [Verrucomicrobiae bacterium]|nr:replication-relaxation family protein [Verrucomicrobiae bacterium]